jgi:hypothetical protein
LVSCRRAACSSVLSAFAIACSRRFRSFSRAASSFWRCNSRRLCSRSNASAAARSALLSVVRGGDSLCGFAGPSFSFSTGRSLGSSACSVKEPFDPTGRFRTTPCLARVAATMAGSRVSFANPCLKTLVREPHASAVWAVVHRTILIESYSAPRQRLIPILWDLAGSGGRLALPSLAAPSRWKGRCRRRHNAP